MKIPALLYHHVSDAFTNNITITPQEFGRHMRWLAENNYRALALDEALGCLRHGQPPPPRSLLITFDDGYEDVYTTAFPILRQFNLPATVYPIVGAVGHWNEWNHRAPYIANHLSWPQIDELQRHGLSFGCHTLTHHSLVRFDPARVRTELQSAQAILADKLGRAVTTLSYPYGDHNAPVRAIAAEFFELAFAVDDGGWDWLANPLAVRRITVRPGTTPDQLQHLLASPEQSQPQLNPDFLDIKT